MGVMNDFVSEISMEVIFELHRAVKLGYYRELIHPDSKNVVRRGSLCCLQYCACTFLLACLLDYKYNHIKSSTTCLEGPLVFSVLCQWSGPWDAQ